MTVTCGDSEVRSIPIDRVEYPSYFEAPGVSSCARLAVAAALGKEVVEARSEVPASASCQRRIMTGSEQNYVRTHTEHADGLTMWLEVSELAVAVVVVSEGGGNLRCGRKIRAWLYRLWQSKSSVLILPRSLSGYQRALNMLRSSSSPSEMMCW